MKVEFLPEVGGHGAGEGEEDIMRDWGDNVLLHGVGGDMGVAEFEGAGEEVEWFGDGGGD